MIHSPRSAGPLVSRVAAALVAACVLVPSDAAAQTEATQPAPDTDQPAKPRPGKSPSLDELLGISPGPDPGAESTEQSSLPDPAQTELERQLTGQQAAQAFVQAVQLMDETAARLLKARDPGVATQRLQEDILRKLDQIISTAEKSPSNSSPSQSQDQQGQQPRQSPQQQQQSENRQGDNQDERDAPAGQDAALGPQAGANPASWGALPERVRDELVQGLSDRFSSLYRSMTESYYRRLAEEREP